MFVYELSLKVLFSARKSIYTIVYLFTCECLVSGFHADVCYLCERVFSLSAVFHITSFCTDGTTLSERLTLYHIMSFTSGRCLYENWRDKDIHIFHVNLLCCFWFVCSSQIM